VFNSSLALWLGDGNGNPDRLQVGAVRMQT